MTKDEIHKLVDDTEDAYSFERYGKLNWADCINMLDATGFTAQNIEAILRSKWMRWAGDMSDNEYGHITADDLKKFLLTMDDLHEQVDQLTRETSFIPA